MAPLIYEAAASFTLGNDDLNQVHFINASADITITLPPGWGWIEIANWGTGVITLNNASAAAIGTIRQYQFSRIMALPDSAGEGAWPTKIVVWGASGELYLEGDLNFRNSAKGVIYTDISDSHKVKQTVNADAPVYTDSGSTSENSASEPDV